ncbi:sigma-54-dependent Fis family transcriptional regulator [bacterium]|nr:sigma-54-dependent Fis family transcriptional regulator [bacterium]
MPKILIVEDDQQILDTLSSLVESMHCEAQAVSSIAEAQEALDQDDIDLVISELSLPDGNGTSIISFSHDTPVLIMTGYASMQSAVESMRMGAVDYIAKPLKKAEMKKAIERIVETKPKRRRDSSKPSVPPVPGMIGDCEAMQDVYNRIYRCGPTRSTVLVRGETGTGKELVARAIHEASDRKDKPMISVNCAAIPETLIESELFGYEKGSFTGASSNRAGLIEAAEGSTLFLDEIGELPEQAQARLLRFIQESEIRRIGSTQSRKVDVRLIAATHRDLKRLSVEGGFRQDLYYRINVMRIDVPPLRERGSDLLKLAEKVLENAATRFDKPDIHFTPDALQAITSYNWPGNVRELENVIERATIMSDAVIDSKALEIDLDSVDVKELSQDDGRDET